MNKKINLILLILLLGLSSFSVNSFAAETLYFRYSDATMVAGNPMKFQYNVQIKASVTNTWITSFTVRSYFNSTTFVGTSSSISIALASAFSTLSTGFTTNPVVAGSPKYYTSSGAVNGSGVEVSTSWVTLLTVTMDVLSPCDLAGLSFDGAGYMTTRNKYKVGGTGANNNYIINVSDVDANWTSHVLGYTAPTSTTWNGSVSSNWGSTGNWTNGVPCSTSNVTVGSGSYPLIIDQDVTCNNLTIAVGGQLTVNTTRALTVNGSFLINSDASGTGSFINNGTSSITGTVERNITAYSTAYDGWRFVSSPVNGGTHTFAPGAGDDFFSYDESLWLCWQYQASPSFTNGKGYLTAYAATAVKSFTGTLNNANVTFTNQSFTPAQQNGFQLLGNPFSSAITWNVGSWGLSNVNSFAYLLNGGGSYTTLSSGGIIPAMQGFLIQVSNATNSLTIPTNARTHSATNILNKSTETERLFIKASSIGNSTYVESIIHTDINATNGFDSDLDANFLAGLSGVPQLYSQVTNNKVSINTVPTIGSSVVSIPMGFVAGDATNYQLTFDGINTFNCSSITLEDLKTNTTQNLMQNSVYNFTSTSGDNVNRFIIHFNSAVGVGEVNKVSGSIYSYGNDIYVNSSETVKQISIYNTIGQLIYTVNNPIGLFKYSLNGNTTGYYIVKVITDKNVNSEKVFVK
ncbi:MAG: T9SS type A sorting domain-containing protein [Bacteroidetes bacterium]|nr:T9SS type A sorting domain-containing protein [Bacteroidota bacterium]